MTGPKRPPRVSAMVRRNAELIAERTGWPEGALAACVRLERECPGFRVAWFAERKTAAVAFNREAGFYAWVAGEQPGLMYGNVWHGRQEWYGATPDELKAKLGG